MTELDSRRSTAGRPSRLTLVVCLLFLPLPSASVAQSPPTVISSSDLLADADILLDAVRSLHPGLYRYNDSLSVESHFAELEDQLQEDRTLAEAYLAFSRFAARIRCGHTYANFWNQPDRVRDEVLRGPTKLPFTFRIVEGRMVVDKDATELGVLERGAEVVRLDGRPVREVLDSLMTVVPADGSNDRKRLHGLQVTGLGEHESFDVYYPLFFPVADGSIEVEYARDDASAVERVVLPTITREVRLARLTSRYGPQADSYDDLWSFEVWDDRAAYMRIGTFVTWQMEMDWRGFLAGAFDTLADRGIDRLLLDVRGNEGGDNAVLEALYAYLISKPITIDRPRELLRYDVVPSDLAPYLDTWDDGFKDRRDRVVEVDGGFFTWIGHEDPAARSRARTPHSAAFQGSVYLLIDAANSSATFQLASLLADHELATLVGQETGGSRRGINGGEMFFLRLPNSQIEIDVPLIGYFPLTDEPDAGIAPDVVIEPSVDDVRRGVDPVLEAVREMVGRR